MNVLEKDMLIYSFILHRSHLIPSYSIYWSYLFFFKVSEVLIHSVKQLRCMYWTEPVQWHGVIRG